MSLLSDTRLGHYELCAKLGAGGMGEVYLAEDTKLHRKVAVKFLPPESTADPRAKKRLLREAQAAAALDHPNICAIHEVGEVDGHAFIVMQYVEGENLAARIQRKPLGLKEALDIVVPLADALAEAHSHSIIHRDIKPQNVMITARGQVKVLDFGLAKVVADRGVLDGEAETKSLLTEAGTIVGTVPYMSPEQVKGEVLDARSDIFSFGTVLYEMISGHRPFSAKTTAEIISAILTREPQPLANYSIAVPKALEQILRKCLEKDRERRYQTMREVATDLETVRRACESGALVVPTVDGAATIIRAAATGHHSGLSAFLTSRLGLALAAVVVLAAVAPVSVWFFRSSRTEPTAGMRPVNSPAYDYYLRGKVLNGENLENNKSAIKLLEQAVNIDPNFAPAWAELARAYSLKASFYAPDAEQKKLNEDAKVAVEKALALNPDLAQGHYVRGVILWTHPNRFPHEQVIQSYKRAIALDPNLEEAHHSLGVVYFHIGLLDKGEEEIKKALAINPSDNLARFRLAAINVNRGKYEEALTMLKSIPPEVNPAIVERAEAIALFQLGRIQEASEVVEDYLKTYPTDEGGNVTSVKAMLLAKAGKEREAEEAIRRAVEIGKSFQHFHHTTYNLACAYALLNKPDEALKWLQFTADDGFPCYPLFENDANLNSLRKDERFIAFMARLKQQWERYNATL
jgi:tetratricopeptide (TPR) repeat protein